MRLNGGQVELPAFGGLGAERVHRRQHRRLVEMNALERESFDALGQFGSRREQPVVQVVHIKAQQV